MGRNHLIIVVGQEGAGKSTLVRALLPRTNPGAQIDAEDIGQINPFQFDSHFKQLLWKNVSTLIKNYWSAGLNNVIAGSFLNDYDDYRRFRHYLPEEISIYLVHLCVSKPVRDKRRIERHKPSSKEWRDRIDEAFPEDASFQTVQADYRYIRIDNSELSIYEAIILIMEAIPEVYGDAAL